MDKDKDLEYSYSEPRGIISGFGKLVFCRHCKRPMIAEAVCTMARTVPEPTAHCLECIEISDGFREDYPDVAAKIDEWKTKYLKKE